MRGAFLILFCSACLSVGTTEATAAGETGGGSISGGLATGGQPSLAVSPTVVDFGNTLIYTTATRSVTLTNEGPGSADDVVCSIDGADQSLFSVDGCPMALNPGASATVEISYSPEALETRSIAAAHFMVGSGAAADLKLFGEPVGIALTLAPNPIAFGYALPGSTPVGCTVLTNQSDLEPQITAIVSGGDGGGAFTLVSAGDATPPISFPIALPGGGSVKLCVEFDPPSCRPYTGEMLVTVTGIPGPPGGFGPIIIPLEGWCGGPQISCTPAVIDFGQTSPGSHVSVPVICVNTGTAIPATDLVISSVSASPSVFSAEFDQSVNPYPPSGLAPGQQTQIDVTYDPTTASDDKGTLFIMNNGAQGQEIQIPLAGQSF